MKKIVLICCCVLFSFISKSQRDESDVTITMALEPILTLNMIGSSNIDFVFDQVSEYVGGIVKYGATSLRVSASVSWDLYAVGTSSQATDTWDQQATYGSPDPGATTNLPVSLLELHQDKPNPFPGSAIAFADYSSPFVVLPNNGSNCIFASSTPYVPPPDGEKYIAGGNVAVPTAHVPGGSYLVAQRDVFNKSVVGAGSNYYYIIDYRIVPGLPPVFPNASLNNGLTKVLTAGTYAQPGIYTMNVKYVLSESQ